MQAHSSLRLSALVGVLSVVAACSGGGESGPDATTRDTVAEIETSTRPLVVLDYSPTISDIGALFYLAANPDVELLAVTLPERGESDCDVGVLHTRSLLMLAGRPDLPIGCGVEPPLVGDRDWPQAFRDFSNTLSGVALPHASPETMLDGALVLADVLEAAPEPVTIVAVGPLTNLGVVFRDRPELVGQVERVVIMGGAVDVPGNVEAAPTAEWNLYIDPEAARVVLASGVDVLLVPLDATNDVPWTSRLVATLGLLDTAIGRAQKQVIASRGFTDGVYLWDELAAVATLHPEMLQIEQRTIVVDDDGATIDDPSGAVVDVAVSADPDAATQEFFRVLNGGRPVELPEATEEELVYSEVLAAGLAAYESAGDELSELDGDPHVAVDRFLATLFDQLGLLESLVAETEPPPALAGEHEAFRAAVAAVVGRESELRAAAAAADGDEFWLLMESAIEATDIERSIDEVGLTCRSIAGYLALRGGSMSCDVF